MNNKNGITLIALIITIIVLLILAGVAFAGLINGNIIGNTENAVIKYNNSVLNEQITLNLIENYLINNGADNNNISTEPEWDKLGEVNRPELVDGMIPVYYEDGVWKKADSTNVNTSKKWYSYTENDKQWANVVTVESKNLDKYKNAEIGTEIIQSEITVMFVWIPRYSYNIIGEKNIEISFLQGGTNKEGSGNITNKIVHPAFINGSKNDYVQGGWDRELTGIWVAKFEASGIENGNYVGNGSASQNVQTESPTKNTYVRILPSAISWRYTNIGEAQYRCMQMNNNTSAYGWASNSVDSHLIKNDEWGAVAYLCYSKYGAVPKINGAGLYNSSDKYLYNYYTGAGPYSGTTIDNANETGLYEFNASHAYNTANGMLASTTGNVYGIYDMSGGAWERVAGFLDNGNRYLEIYGNSSTDSNVVFFEKNEETGNYELKGEYKKYWNRYEVGSEEKSNKIRINDNLIVTQSELWQLGKEANEARLRITTETFNNFKNYKGIGVSEITDSFSYYGIYNTGTGNVRKWFTDLLQPENGEDTFGRGWDDDAVLIGHADFTFIARGSGAGDLDGKARSFVHKWLIWESLS